MNFLARVLQDEELRSRPPVLIDVGASGALPSEWAPLAAVSTCLAFDADAREFRSVQDSDSGWKRLVTFNRLLVPAAVDEATFYLTKSPYCSSTLRPNAEGLKPWLFRDLFSVVDESSLPAITLTQVLSDADVSYVDWFKSDSQGTDLRLLKSLPPQILDGLLSCDLEPGIIDAYEGEDKLSDVLAYMAALPFFLCQMNVNSVQRSTPEIEQAFKGLQRKFISSALPDSPGWAELCFLRELAESAPLARRDALLLWVISTIRGQHGYAWSVADHCGVSGDPLLAECSASSRDRLHARWGAVGAGAWTAMRYKLRHWLRAAN